MLRTVVFIMLLAACTTGRNDILREDEFVLILTDMQKVNSAAFYGLLPENYVNDPQQWFVDLATSHHTDTATFNRTMRYYSRYPKKLRKVYLQVQKNLESQ